MARMVSPEGFEAPNVTLPTPPVPVSDMVRERIVLILAALAKNALPEDIPGYQQNGFPNEVTGLLAEPLMTDEMHAWVDLLLCELQAPALAAAPN